jgi:hypothetical protein
MKVSFIKSYSRKWRESKDFKVVKSVPKQISFKTIVNI